MKQTFMENGRTSVENRGGMKEEGTVGGPAGTGKKRSHRLPEAAEVDRNLPIQVAAVCRQGRRNGGLVAGKFSVDVIKNFLDVFIHYKAPF